MVGYKNKVTVLILTKDEDRHIGRAIDSVKGFASNVYVIDSFSTDNTVEIAKARGANVLQNKFLNHSQQFNWGLSQLPPETEWVLRLDADEVCDDTFSESVLRVVSHSEARVGGYSVNRTIFFLGKRIKWGGVFPHPVTRLFRYGAGTCDGRLMDEHIVIRGVIKEFGRGNIFDISLKSLGWWIEKHNGYASREAFEILDHKYLFTDRIPQSGNLDKKASRTRYIKNNIYILLPPFFKTLAIFVYRVVFRLGFLDGPRGIAFHFFQGFWYRFLVEEKVREAERALQDGVPMPVVASEILGLKNFS